MLPLQRIPLLALLSSMTLAASAAAPALRLNDSEYLEMPGLNVMLAHDYYPEGHQGGISIIQNGSRVATNGDLRLDRTPGQWQPVPKAGSRKINRDTQEISLHLSYPDPEKNRTSFNPVIYPALNLGYTVRMLPEGKAFRVIVDLDEALPPTWEGRVSFNLELFPGLLFGKTWSLDAKQGIFPLQSNGPGSLDASGDCHVAEMARGRRLVVAPETESQRLGIEVLAGGDLELIDGRGQHSNGWFVVRSITAPGAAKRAIEWRISPNALPDFLSPPVIQVSQVGYHPSQDKIALVELDANDSVRRPLGLQRINPDGSRTQVLEAPKGDWGRFLRFNYLRFDFSQVKEPGTYVVSYGDTESHAFLIAPDVFQRGVWQPTLEYFLPVQMCHMRINDRYRVWHGACHLDDARMAPVDHNHFDGYHQGVSTLCRFSPGDHVPGLDRGGWHDAGDDDLRVESQAETVRGLALAYETFAVAYDNTTIDQEKRLVEIHRPDGKPDMLQQVEHGALSIIGGYKSLGRLYRGIITPTLRQYVLLGDPVNVTDNQIEASGDPLKGDDRWVFTEKNPMHELQAAAGLAAASRVLKKHNPELAGDCLRIAQELWTRADARRPGMRITAAVELLLATGDKVYADFLADNTEAIRDTFIFFGWEAVRALKAIDREAFTRELTAIAKDYAAKVDEMAAKTPYGVPYEPAIWGAGWMIQRFGVQQCHLHKAFPALFGRDHYLQALNFILGVHPGANTASFVSGVGTKSATTAYGFNRADWSHIPGGIISGTALIRPDFPELLEWPFLWQQTEYVLGGGTTDYLFLALSAATEP